VGAQAAREFLKVAMVKLEIEPAESGPLVESGQLLAQVSEALASGEEVRLDTLRAEYQSKGYPETGTSPTTTTLSTRETSSLPSEKPANQGGIDHPSDKISIDLDNRSGVYEPNRLISLYLQGKLSQGELAFHLRAYNSVLADTIMRQSRYDITRAVDYVEVPQPSMAKPGGVYHEPRQPTAKEKDQGGGMTPEVDESTNKHKKEEEQQKQQEDARQEAIQLQFTEETNREVFNAQVWREIHHKELMRQEGFENEANSLIDGALEGADRTKTGVTDAIRNKSPHHRRHSSRENFLQQLKEEKDSKEKDKDEPLPPPLVSVS
jgi:hypothetical protein